MPAKKMHHDNVVALAPAEPRAEMTFTQAMMPRNLTEAMAFCDRLSKSSMCPKNLQGDGMGIMVAIQAGERHGFDVLGSIQNIAVINGKPSMYGDALLGSVKASGHFESIQETSSGTLENQDYMARCVVRRKGETHEVVGIFTYAMAERADLINKVGPWKTYPERMFKMRARGFALRDAFPDVLSGLISAEEAEDYAVKDQHGQRSERPRGPIVEGSHATAGLPPPDNDAPSSAPSPSASPPPEVDTMRRYIDNAKTLQELQDVHRVIRQHRKSMTDVEAAAMTEAYKTRKTALSGGDRKGAHGLEARLDAMAPDCDPRTGEVRDDPWSDNNAPPPDDDLGYGDDAGMRG